MLGEPTVVLSNAEGQELSFAEILDQSPPLPTEGTKAIKEGHKNGSHKPGLKHQTSISGLFGRFGIRSSVLRKENTLDRRRSIRASLSTDSLTAIRAPQVPTGPERNRSYSNDMEESTIKPMSPTKAFQRASAKKERVRRMISDPPPLGSSYSQAVKHGSLLAPSGSVEAVLRTHRTQGHSKKTSLDASATSKRLGTPLSDEGFVAKTYVLTTTGYLLQYAGEGNYDRMPEGIMQLSSSSAAMACDAIAGKHWVLHVSATFDTPHSRSRFGLTKLGLVGARGGARNFLLIMDSADEMEGWLVALRREIHSLGGADYKPDMADEKALLEEQVEQRISHEKVATQDSRASLAVTRDIARPSFYRATSAPDKVATHRLTSSMAKQGLLLRMDESESEEEPEVTVSAPNMKGQVHGHADATSPHSVMSISDKNSHHSRPSTDTLAPRNTPTGRRRSGSQTQSLQSGQAQLQVNDLDSVIQSIIPQHSSRPVNGSFGRRYTGLRKKASILKAQSMSPLVDASQTIATKSSKSSTHSSLQPPLSSGFKRLSPLVDVGPIVLTPPESPELNLRRRSMSVLEQESKDRLSPKGSLFSQYSPISDPGMLSPNGLLIEPMALKSPTVNSSSLRSVPRSPDRSPTNFSNRNGSTSTLGSSATAERSGSKSTGWIPPRHSSLLYSQGKLPSSAGSSSVSSPSSARKASLSIAKTEKLKSKLAALDIINVPIADALLLAPSPHPPPTGALPELPKNKSPGSSRPASRQDQSRKPSIASAISGRSASVTSMAQPIATESSGQAETATHSLIRDSRAPSVASTRRPSDTVNSRTTTPEPRIALTSSSSPVEQIAPRKPRVEKVILPPMSEVPATIYPAEASLHLGSDTTPLRLTVAERRRRRSPSPVHARGRSNSTTEKVLSAISEMTEASEAPRALEGMITIGLEVPQEEQNEMEDKQDDGSKPQSHGKGTLRPDSNLLPNGMPNPLAANPIRTPDMRMIPHSHDQPPPVPAVPTRLAPAPPIFPAGQEEKSEEPIKPAHSSSMQLLKQLEYEDIRVHYAGSLQARPHTQKAISETVDNDEKETSDEAKPISKVSMRERAAAAIAAAKASHGHVNHRDVAVNNFANSSTTEIAREKVSLPANPKAMKQASAHGHVKKKSAEAVLAPAVAPVTIANTTAANMLDESVRSSKSGREESLREEAPLQPTSTIPPRPSYPPRTSSATAIHTLTSSPPSTKLAGTHTPPVHNPSTATAILDKPVPAPLRPISSTEKEVLPDVTLSPFAFTNPAISSSSHPPATRAKHIAEVLFIPELPAEPTTPTSPAAPIMQASITGFAQDEFDMWAWPVGEAQRRPVSMLPPLALGGDGEDDEREGEEVGPDSEGSPASRGAKGAAGKAKFARWSLFNAIDGIQ